MLNQKDTVEVCINKCKAKCSEYICYHLQYKVTLSAKWIASRYNGAYVYWIAFVCQTMSTLPHGLILWNVITANLYLVYII